MKTFRVGSCYEINGRVFKMIDKTEKIYESKYSYHYVAKFVPANELLPDPVECAVGYGMGIDLPVETIVLDVVCRSFDDDGFGKIVVYADKNRVKYNPKTDRYE